jgi:7-carboxy-7-deazaguanine synthase
MKIAELFYSIQGEGSLIGVPSVFVRTSGCNLRCSWCDTPYTSWNPEGEERSVDEVLELVGAHPARHVVVTGGEPMIAPEIVALTEQLRASSLHITIETAGTVFAAVACDLMSISPKLAHSTPEGRLGMQHERLRFQPEVLQRLIAAYNYQLKFVVSHPDDLAEIERMLERISADRAKVILMPEGIEPKILHERGVWLAEIAKSRGFRFSPRLHVELWGNRRGV